MLAALCCNDNCIESVEACLFSAAAFTVKAPLDAFTVMPILLSATELLLVANRKSLLSDCARRSVRFLMVSGIHKIWNVTISLVNKPVRKHP